MSRIGKAPIEIPEKVTIEVKDSVVTVTGPNGELVFDNMQPFVNVEIAEGMATVTVEDSSDHNQAAFWGTTAALIRNMVTGVTDGFEKRLEINGVGYQWSVSGKKLNVKAGYSHPVDKDIPEGLDVSIEDGQLVVKGASKQQVGQFAAEVRAIRPPEPYKGKGIKYADETIRRKVGKQGVGGE